MEPDRERLDPHTTQSLLRSTNPTDRQELFERLYGELKRIASLRLHRAGQSLHTTELVHEAYLKLVGAAGGKFNDRAHFCAVAAKAMRQILVDRARARQRLKRGGGEAPAPLHETDVIILDEPVDTLALDEALKNLAEFDERLARVVELRSFGGLTLEEIGAVLEVSTATVKVDWRTARAWLRRFLKPPSTI